jgi:hypothetical protein
LAATNFEPIQVFLDEFSERLANEYGPSATLERRGGMQPTAKNAFQVQYSLRIAGDVPLSLAFILTGANADLILLQGHQRSAARDVSANPGQFDQHVYRLEELDELKEALREKIIDHLAPHQPEEGAATRVGRSAQLLAIG